MNKIVLFLVYWSIPASLIGIGCAMKAYNKVTQVPAAHLPSDKEISPEEARECIDKQVELYNDLCAEGRECQGGPEEEGEYCTDEAADKRGSATLLIENHFLGVECAADAIRRCLGLD